MKTINKKYKMSKNKIMLIVLLALTPMIGFSQSLFEKYEDLDEVTTVVVSKSAFRLLGKIGAESNSKNHIDIEDAKSLDNLYVFTTEDQSIADEMYLDVKKYLKSENLSELFRIKDKDGNVKIYVREGKDDDHVKEIFMVIKNIKHVKLEERNPSIVVMSLTGDIDLNKVGRIMDKMNVPGGKHIKKATNK